MLQEASMALCTYNILVKMSAKFSWDDSIDDEKEKILNINAPAALLSYIRPLISSMTGNLKYPALNIPFIDFTQTEKENSHFGRLARFFFYFHNII